MGKNNRPTYSFLFKSIDISILVFFRIAFGILMLIEVTRFFINDWISAHYIVPPFHFSYYGFDWIQPLSGDYMYLHFVALGILSICIIFGFKYRVATILFFLGFSYIFLLDKALYLNHFYLIILISFIMIFVPANKAFSFDAKLKPMLHATTVHASSLWLLRIQIGIVYFYGGIAKINSDWLQGEPLRTWLSSQTNFPLIGSYFTNDGLVYLFSYGALLIDLLAFPLLLIRQTRLPMFIVLVVFHILNSELFEIGIFPPFMIAATLLFFSPDWPRNILQWFRTKKYPTKTNNIKTPKSILVSINSTQKVGTILMIIFVVIQVAIPLQPHFYPGNVLWTEEGLNFSWHMMLRDKDTTELEFYVTDPIQNKTWNVIPHDLTLIQFSKMSYQPDLILQYSHYIADDISKLGYEEIEVRAKVVSSLNGREPQLLIDPQVNLAMQERNLSHSNWITPLN